MHRAECKQLFHVVLQIQSSCHHAPFTHQCHHHTAIWQIVIMRCYFPSHILPHNRHNTSCVTQWIYRGRQHPWARTPSPPLPVLQQTFCLIAQFPQAYRKKMQHRLPCLQATPVASATMHNSTWPPSITYIELFAPTIHAIHRMVQVQIVRAHGLSYSLAPKSHRTCAHT